MTDIQDTPAEEAAQKATTLIESLPWLKKFRDNPGIMAEALRKALVPGEGS